MELSIRARSTRDTRRCRRATRASTASSSPACTTTGIYCRPSCPAITPKRGNVRFFRTAAAAHDAGLRACKRCQPDAVPGSPDWNLHDDLASRAMRLVQDGVVEREGVDGLARRLGYTPRHVSPRAADRARRRPARPRPREPRPDRAIAARRDGAADLRHRLRRRLRQPAPVQRHRRCRVPGDAVRAAGDRPPRRHEGTARSRRSGSGCRGRRRADPAAPGPRALRFAPGCSGSSPITPSRDSSSGDDVALPARAGAARRACRGRRSPPTPSARACSSTARLARPRRCPGARRPRAPHVRPRRRLGRDRHRALRGSGARAARRGRPRHPDRRQRRRRGGAVPHPHRPADLRRGGADRARPAGRRSRRAGRDSRPPRRSPSAAPRCCAVPRPASPRILRAADAVASGELRLDVETPAAELRERLLALPGIGPWTADYLAMRVLGNPDVLITTDLVDPAVRRCARPPGRRAGSRARAARAGRHGAATRRSTCGGRGRWRARQRARHAPRLTAVPSISVVIPVRNDAAMLDHRLESLAAQTRQPDEIVVVDNGSSDASAMIAERAGARVVAEPRRGIPYATCDRLRQRAQRDHRPHRRRHHLPSRTGSRTSSAASTAIPVSTCSPAARRSTAATSSPTGSGAPGTSAACTGR